MAHAPKCETCKVRGKSGSVQGSCVCRGCVQRLCAEVCVQRACTGVRVQGACAGVCAEVYMQGCMCWGHMQGCVCRERVQGRLGTGYEAKAS